MLKMTQEEAQKVLDERNGNFQIISYNGMRNNSEVICLHCGSQFSTSIDSLLRKTGTSFGCSYCNFQRIKDKLQNNSLEFISRNKDKTINVKCKNCNHIITNRTSILTNPKYLCKYCSSDARLSKIINNPKLYSISTINHAIIDWNIRCLIETHSLEWYYILGLLISDGSFDNVNNRVVLALKKSDKDCINKIANIIGCKVTETSKTIGIDFCCGTIKSIIEKYSISNAKTYNPCDISSLNDKELIAFIIGFIDGDGNIGYRSDTKSPRITIKLHNSWFRNLKYISDGLYKYFGVIKSPNPVLVRQDNKVYATITFGNKTVLRGLYDFIKINSIPAMKRKWNRLEVLNI